MGWTGELARTIILGGQYVEILAAPLLDCGYCNVYDTALQGMTGHKRRCPAYHACKARGTAIWGWEVGGGIRELARTMNLEGFYAETIAAILHGSGYCMQSRSWSLPMRVLTPRGPP